MIPFYFFSCKEILKYGNPKVLASTSHTPTLPMENEIWRTQSTLDAREIRKRSRPIALPIALFTCGTTFRSMRICITGNPLEPKRRTSTKSLRPTINLFNIRQLLFQICQCLAGNCCGCWLKCTRSLANKGIRPNSCRASWNRMKLVMLITFCGNWPVIHLTKKLFKGSVDSEKVYTCASNTNANHWEDPECLPPQCH